MPTHNQSSNVKHKRADSAIDAIPLDVSAADSTFGGITRALLVGVAGDIEVTTLGGRKVTLTAVPVGILPLCVSIVHTANTTATDITALF